MDSELYLRENSQHAQIENKSFTYGI